MRSLLLFRFIKLSLVSLVFITVSCSDPEEIIPRQNPKTTETENSSNNANPSGRVAGSFYEDFEAGTKTAYTAANVTLATGSWNFSEALIGTSTSDPKTGAKSVRIRETGFIRMNFNVSNGATTINVKHGKYGSDGNSTWELWMSWNGGSSYSKIGSPITPSST